MVVLRWAAFVAYTGLVASGAVKVDPADFIASSLLLTIYCSLFGMAVWRSGPDTRFLKAVPFLDTLCVSILIIAVGDPTAPLWAAYFLSNVVAAHFLTQRESLLNLLWTNFCYLAAVGVTAAHGAQIAWETVAIVSVLIHLLGHHAGALAGAQGRLRRELAHGAETDALTGLLNRHTLYARLEGLMLNSQTVSLFVIDVDNLKVVNDARGHLAGDAMLRDLASCLRDLTRSPGFAARFGGDEFIVAIPALSEAGTAGFAGRLRHAMSSKGIEVSIGWAIYPEDAGHSEELIACADAALYRDKRDRQQRSNLVA